ncbi:hypothetical protein HDU89_001064 [Geranomyces variabilis]|nr:hypothetical protein HDU89_001064 [Geranomyces variabilis]
MFALKGGAGLFPNIYLASAAGNASFAVNVTLLPNSTSFVGAQTKLLCDNANTTSSISASENTTAQQGTITQPWDSSRTGVSIPIPPLLGDSWCTASVTLIRDDHSYITLSAPLAIVVSEPKIRSSHPIQLLQTQQEEPLPLNAINGTLYHSDPTALRVDWTGHFQQKSLCEKTNAFKSCLDGIVSYQYNVANLAGEYVGKMPALQFPSSCTSDAVSASCLPCLPMLFSGFSQSIVDSRLCLTDTLAAFDALSGTLACTGCLIITLEVSVQACNEVNKCTIDRLADTVRYSGGPPVISDMAFFKAPYAGKRWYSNIAAALFKANISNSASDWPSPANVDLRISVSGYMEEALPALFDNYALRESAFLPPDTHFETYALDFRGTAYQGERYVFSLEARSGASIAGINTADICLDATPPIPGFARFTELVMNDAAQTASVLITGFEDPEAGIKEIWTRMGNDSSTCNKDFGTSSSWVNYTSLAMLGASVSSEQSVSVDLTTALADQWPQVFFSIAVINHAYTFPGDDGVTYSCLNPLTLDVSTPTIVITQINVVGDPTTANVTNETDVEVHWLASDIVAGIAFVTANLSAPGLPLVSTGPFYAKNSSLTISSTALPANTSITVCMNATSNSKPVSIVSTCTSTILPKRVVFDRSCVNSGVTYNALQDGDQRATGSLWADWAKCSLADTAIVNFWLVTSADFQMIHQGSAQVKDGGVSVNLGISWPSDLYKFCFMSMTTTDLITNNFCLGEQLVDPIPPQSTGRFCDAYSGRGLDPTAVPVRTSSNFVQYLVRWDTWASSPSGIANFTVTLEGTAPQRTVSTAVVPAEETAYLFQNLSLTADEFYYATLSSTNSAGLSSRVIKSPGVVVSDISSRTPVINVYGGTLIQQSGQAVVLFRARNQTSMHVTWGGFRGDAAQVPNFMLQLVSWTASPTIPPYNYRATQHDAVVPIPGLAGMYNLSVTSVNLDGTELISTFPSPIRVAGGTSISPPATLHCDVDFSKFDPVRKTLPFSASWSGISDPEHFLVMQRLGFRRVGETSRTSSMTSLDLLATSATGILQYVYGPPTILDHWTSIECVYEAEDLSGDFISAVYNGSTHDAIAAFEPAVLTLSAWTDMSLPSSETDFAFFADISVTTNSTFMIGLQSFPPIIRDGVQIANLSYSIHSADPMAADDGPSTIIVPPTPVYGSRQHISHFQVLVGSTLVPITLFSPIAFVEQGGVQHDMSTVYVCVTAYTAHPNKTVSACSTGIMKDTVSPVAGSVIIEAVNSDRTTRYITDTEISISWSGFIKPNWPYPGETGISEYKWGIGSYSGADDYASFTKVSGNDQNAKVTAVLADGAIIYATVLASDHAGRTVSAISSPVIVDTTPPVSASSTPTVLAKSNLDGTVFVRAYFDPFVDGESGVSSVLWTVETAYGAEDVLPPQIATFYNVAYATLPLPPDATYLLRILATNGAGLSTEITKVFTTASPVRLVYLVDGADPKQTKLFDREPSSYTSRWKLAGDLMDVVVGVGTAPRLGNLRPFERVNSSLSTGELTIPLQVNDGAEIYTTIFAQDTTGGSYQYFSSHGMVVDRSAPVRGWVTVGNRMVHQMVVPRQAAISASWIGFSDAESDIDRYEYCLDLNDDVDNPLCSISGWVNVWKQLRVIDAPIVGSVLPIGQQCFVKVRATNMVGLSVVATSPPFTVDPAAPQGGRASISFPGVDSGNSMSPIALDGSQLYLDRSCVNVSWSSFTGNVIKYRVALLQEPGNIVVPFRSVGVMTSWTFAGLNLTSRGPGSEYRAAVQAWTAAGIYSEITTPFRVVDGRPGPGTLTVVSASDSSVLFYVTGFADPNPLKVQYEISVGKNPYGAEGPPVVRLDCGSTICSYTYEWTLGSAPPGTIFYLSVRAFNEAGLFSDPATTPVMLPVPMADGLSAGRGTWFLWNVTASNPFLNAYQTDAILTGGNLTLFLVNSTAVLPVTCNFNKTISTTGKLAVVGDNFKDPVVTCPAPYNEVSEGGYLTLVVQINNVLSNPVVFWRREITSTWTSSIPQCGLFLNASSVYRISSAVATISWTNAVTNIGFFKIKVGNSLLPQIWPPTARKATVHVSMTSAPGVFSVCAYFIGSTDANSRCIAAPAIKTGNLAPTINPATVNAHPLLSTVRVNTERLVPLGTSQYVGLTPVTASWDGTFVAEAGKVMVSYRLLLGTSPATAMNGSWLSTTATTASLAGDLVAGVPYFASVIAFDEVGLATIEYSSALISDISPPDVGTVHIGKSYYNQDVVWQATSSSLDFFLENWSDHISGIRNFAYRVCEARQCGPKIVVGITVSVTASVALEPGVAYWVSVQATNGAGLTSQWVNSSVVTVDERPAQITSITFSGVNGAFAATPGTNLTLNWQATGLYAPIQEYAVQIGTTRGGGQLLAPTSVGGMSSFSLSGLALQHNTVIYATVRAKSSNGLDSVAISDGLHVDFTPPRVIGMVKVLDATSYVMAVGLVNVSMSWKDVFSEPESAIVSYQYAIGTPGLPSLYTNGFLDAGTSVSAVYECFPADDSHFVVTVRATNVPGATVTATSGLVMKSATAPTAFTLSILNEDTVTVNGTCFIPSSIARFSLDNLADPVSGIQHVQIQLIDAANGVAIQDWFSIDDLAFLSLEAADSEGLLRPLKINARAFNYVGLISLASSETFILTERIPL